MPRLCLAMDLRQRFLAISTIIHLLVITTERYIMTVCPLAYSRIMEKSRILTVLVYHDGLSPSSPRLSTFVVWPRMERNINNLEQRLNLRYILFDCHCVTSTVIHDLRPRPHFALCQATDNRDQATNRPLVQRSQSQNSKDKRSVAIGLRCYARCVYDSILPSGNRSRF